MNQVSTLSLSLLLLASAGLTACDRQANVTPAAPSPMAQSAVPDATSSSAASGAMSPASGASTPSN